MTYTVLAEESKTNDSVGSLANEVDQSPDSLITGHVTKVESVNSEDDSGEDLEIIEDIDAIDSGSEDFDGDVLSDQSDEGTESSDDSLAITSPPRILSLVPCLPRRGQCVEDAEYHLGSVLLGPLNRTQGRQLIAEVRATRRPACYNSKVFDFMRQQRASNRSILTCCHAQHCDNDRHCHVLASPISLREGEVVGICVPGDLE